MAASTSPHESQDVIAIMVKRIVTQFDPVRIILFGSRARGVARPDSDVDLLVILPSIPDKRRTAVAIRRALNGVQASKDIIVATPQEIADRGNMIGNVLRPALREGKVLYERG